MAWQGYGGRQSYGPSHYGYGTWGSRWYWAFQNLRRWKRVTGGWSYGRRIQVTKLEVDRTAVTATVQGADWSTHAVRIRFRPFPDEVWQTVVRAVAAEARHGVSLLAGQIPDGLEEALAATGPSLLPASDDEIAAECSCDDPMVPCKHMVAVCYALYQRITLEPVLLLALRGRTAEDIAAELRAMRAGDTASPDAAAEPPAEPEGALSLPVDGPEAFWRAGPGIDAVSFSFRPPAEDALPVKHLGAVPYGLNRKEFTAIMERAYQAISAHALRLALGEREAMSDAR